MKEEEELFFTGALALERSGIELKYVPLDLGSGMGFAFVFNILETT
ncbi:MAG: hypothetical protein ACH349_05835 [Candidatus Rhabdochlamydia sp.]|jgi:hypothetical protein